MKAVILAAGIGSRLGSYTKKKPKCLININEEYTILDTQLQSLIKAEIADITIVIGYLGQQVEEYVNKNYQNLKVHFIKNEEYDKTNNMYSFSLAESKLKGSSIISLNGDVAIDIDIIDKVLNNNNLNGIAVDTNFYSHESMKIIVENGNSNIVDISKAIDEESAYGTSIDIYKISKESSDSLFSDIKEYLENKGTKDWFEVALHKNFDKENYYPISIGSSKWVEIDDEVDLLSAKELFI